MLLQHDSFSPHLKLHDLLFVLALFFFLSVPTFNDKYRYIQYYTNTLWHCVLCTFSLFVLELKLFPRCAVSVLRGNFFFSISDSI